MPAEYEDLKLTVTLADNASAGLAHLQNQIQGLTSGQTGAAFEKLRRQSLEISTVFKQTSEESSKLATVLTRSLGPGFLVASTAVGGFGLTLAAVGNKLAQFSQQALNLKASANALGLLPGQLQILTDQLEKVMSPEQAQANLKNFANTLQEFGRLGNRARVDFIRAAGATGPAAEAFANRLVGFQNRGEMANAIREAVEQANRIFESERGRVGEAQAARERDAFMKRLGLGPEMTLVRELHEASKDELATWNRRIELATQFNEEWVKSLHMLRDFAAGMSDTLLPAFRDLNAQVNELGETWGRWAGSQLGRALKDVGDLAGMIKSVVEFLDKASNAGKAAHDFVFGRRQVDQPPWPQSSNIEDRRNEAVDENTRALIDLNEILGRGALGGGAMPLLGGTAGGLSGGVRAGLGGDGGALGRALGMGSQFFPGRGAAPYGSSVGAGSGPGAGATTPGLSGTSGSGSAWPSDRMAPTGTSTSAAGATTVVTTKSGAKFRVAAPFAENFRGFLNDFEAAGGQVDPRTSGGLNTRGNPSYHPIGRAIDVNQLSRDRILSGLPGGIAQEQELAHKWGLRAGSEFGRPDRGHYEVNSRERALAALKAQGVLPPAASTTQQGTDVSGIAGSLGGSPGTRMTRGDRNKNPGNIKRGAESEAFGAIGYDEQDHAIFPTWEAGNAAQAAMLRRLYANRTVPQMGRRYAEDAGWARGVMRYGGYGADEIPDMNTPEGMERLQAAIRRQEGTHVPIDLMQARRTMDRGARDSVRVDAHGKLKVDVNAPKGTSVSAEGSGLFRTVETNRQVQMEPARSTAAANPGAAAPR
jgi:hypothetical protein